MYSTGYVDQFATVIFNENVLVPVIAIGYQFAKCFSIFLIHINAVPEGGIRCKEAWINTSVKSFAWIHTNWKKCESTQNVPLRGCTHTVEKCESSQISFARIHPHSHMRGFTRAELTPVFH